MSDPRAALQQHFGFSDFRPGQEEAVRAAMAGRDVLVVMPTGAGKSLCYQLPALMREDLTIVVSPLVSLMQDQIDALAGVAPGRAALVNAQRNAADNRETLARAAGGELRLLYVAPERFSSPGFLDALRQVRVGLFVVDEAHCVSQWGHDFRPDYFRLADAARWLGSAAIVASTATATPQVANDIVRRLQLRDPVRVTTGFDRPNLSFAVLPCSTAGAKRRAIVAALVDPRARPAIVYAGTRAGSQELGQRLERELGIEVLCYHAGLGREARAEVQRRFMAGEAEIVVATNAFGMGVDKADVRTVVHDGVPASVEAYYQEAGRAGRDGQPAHALLLAEPKDKALHVFFIRRDEVDEARLERVATRLLRAATAEADGDGAAGRFDVALQELGGEDEHDRIRAIVGHLARAGVVQPAPAPADRLRGRVLAPFDGRTRAACRQSVGEAGRARWRQYRAVWAFVEGGVCRRQAMLRHFGDRAEPAPEVPCCDICAPVLTAALIDGAARANGGGAGARTATAGNPPRDLDGAIVAVVEGATPSVGRTRVVEILRGGRSKVVRKHSYDGLPGYGAFDHLTAGQVLARVDELIVAGRLVSSGGAYPKLRVAVG